MCLESGHLRVCVRAVYEVNLCLSYLKVWQYLLNRCDAAVTTGGSIICARRISPPGKARAGRDVLMAVFH